MDRIKRIFVKFFIRCSDKIHTKFFRGKPRDIWLTPKNTTSKPIMRWRL